MMALDLRHNSKEKPSGNADLKEHALTLCHILDAKAEAMPAHVPLVIDGRIKLNFEDWVSQSNRVANALCSLGVKNGDRIALLFDGLDWRDYAITYVAALRCGATVIHLNGHLVESEIHRRLNECNVKWIIRSPFITPPKNFSGLILTLADLEGDKDRPMTPSVEKDAIAEIRYTSGTTGAAKGYTVPHANLTFGRTLETMKALSNSSSMLVPMTLGNSTSATILSIAITSQNTMNLCASFDIERLGQLIESEHADSLMLTPNIARQIVEFQLNKRYNLSSVKILASASSPIPPSLVVALMRMFAQAKLQIACAQSEASPALLIQDYDLAYPFSVGKPSPITESKIMDQNEKEVLDGQTGELWLRTAAPKRLFLNAADVNAQLIQDGWYRTSDLVRKNVKGDIEFFDRKSDVLTRGDKLFSSIMLEAVILQHPKVRDVAVVGISDMINSQLIVAFVILWDPNALAEIRSDLHEQLPDIHYPDKFIAISALPRTDNGKILKRQLRLDLGGR